jgi:hypothetical protein
MESAQGHHRSVSSKDVGEEIATTKEELERLKKKLTSMNN